MTGREFAYTGVSPATGYVGYVNLKETENGVRFSVRSEGDEASLGSYEIPKAEAIKILRDALAVLDPD